MPESQMKKAFKGAIQPCVSSKQKQNKVRTKIIKRKQKNKIRTEMNEINDTSLKVIK